MLGGGAEGKGLKNQKGKQKETATTTEVKDDDEDADAMWMVNAEVGVRLWLADFRDEEFEHWEEYESAGESWEEDWVSDDIEYDEYHTRPSSHTNRVGSSVPNLIPDSPYGTLSEAESEVSRIFESDGNPFTESIMECSDEDSDSLPDLISISDSSGESNVDEDDEVKDDGFESTYVDDVIIDKRNPHLHHGYASKCRSIFKSQNRTL